MHIWAYYIWAILLLVGCVAGWLTTLVTLPGNWIIAGLAALFAWLIPISAGGGITWTVVAVLVGLAVVGEVLEFGAGAAGAAKQGASKRSVALAMLGAAIGSMAGLGIGLPIPILGSLIMAVLGGAGGAFAGAYVGESWKGRPVEDRMAAGRGAFAGRIWGTVGKLVVGMIMLVIVAWEALL